MWQSDTFLIAAQIEKNTMFINISGRNLQGIQYIE